jgi:hypothetical protein
MKPEVFYFRSCHSLIKRPKQIFGAATVDRILHGAYKVIWSKNNTTNSYLYAFSVTDSAPSKTLNPAEAPVISNGSTQSKTPRKMTADVKNNPKYERYKGIILNNGKFIEGSIIGINNQIVSIRTSDDQIKKYHFVNDVQKFVDR